MGTGAVYPHPQCGTRTNLNRPEMQPSEEDQLSNMQDENPASEAYR
jgi:hypothetical protein